MKYLELPKHRLVKQLDVIMGLRSVDGDMPFKELDALYSYPFSCVEDLTITLKILGFLFFGKPYLTFTFTPHFLALLVGLDEEDVHSHLSELHSIVNIPLLPNPGALEIRPTHASLQDFLVDRLRSMKYHFDEEVFHTNVARQCVHQISMPIMNPDLQEAIYNARNRYLVRGFVHHCIRASTDSTYLKAKLMQVSDLRPFFRMRPAGITDFPKLFPWLYKVRRFTDVLCKIIDDESQADGAVKELSSYI